jgi:putative multiple sugar transport system permease protein
MVGGLVMAVLNSGLSLLGVGADVSQIIKGLVLLAAVAFDVYNKQQGRPSNTGLFLRKKDKPTEGDSGAGATVTPPEVPAVVEAKPGQTP